MSCSRPHTRLPSSHPAILGHPSCGPAVVGRRLPASHLGGTSLRVCWMMRGCGLLKRGNWVRDRSVMCLKCPTVSLTVPCVPLSSPHIRRPRSTGCAGRGGGAGMGWGRGDRRRALPAGVPAGWCGALRAHAARAQDRESAGLPQDPALNPFSGNVCAQCKLHKTMSTATCPVQRRCPCSHRSAYSGMFPSPQQSPTPLAVTSPHHTLLPGKPLIYFPSPWLCPFWVIHVNRIIKQAFTSGFFHST